MQGGSFVSVSLCSGDAACWKVAVSVPLCAGLGAFGRTMLLLMALVMAAVAECRAGEHQPESHTAELSAAESSTPKSQTPQSNTTVTSKNDPAFDEWWRGIVDIVKNSYDFEGMVVSVRREFTYQPTPENMQDLRRHLAVYPEAREARDKISYAENTLREGPQRRETTLWTLNGKYRINCTSGTTARTRTWDIAVKKDSAWAVHNRKTLTLQDPAQWSSPSHDWGSYRQSERIIFDLLFVGGMRWVPRTCIESLSPVQNGSTWNCNQVVSFENRPMRVEARGSWDHAARSGTVESVTTSKGAAPELEIRRTVARDWVLDPVAQRYRATIIENQSTVTPQYDDRVSFIQLEEFRDQRSFDALVALPNNDVPDPIRGPLQISEIEDRRSREPTFTTVSEGKTAITIPESQLPHKRAGRSLQYLGWAGLASVVVGIVAWKYARRR